MDEAERQRREALHAEGVDAFRYGRSVRSLRTNESLGVAEHPDNAERTAGFIDALAAALRGMDGMWKAQ